MNYRCAWCGSYIATNHELWSAAGRPYHLSHAKGGLTAKPEKVNHTPDPDGPFAKRERKGYLQNPRRPDVTIYGHEVPTTFSSRATTVSTKR